MDSWFRGLRRGQIIAKKAQVFRNSADKHIKRGKLVMLKFIILSIVGLIVVVDINCLYAMSLGTQTHTQSLFLEASWNLFCVFMFHGLIPLTLLRGLKSMIQRTFA
jgi:hypothetical protein